MFGESKLNLVLVVGAVLVILIGWQFLMPVFFPPPPPRAVTVEQEAAQPDASGQAAPSESVQVEDGTAVTVRERAEAIAGSDRITVDGDRVRGSILLKGARFDDVTLKDYRE